jgi:hypothetical protein
MKRYSYIVSKQIMNNDFSEVNLLTANFPSTRKAKGRIAQKKIRADIIEHIKIDEHDILSTPMGQTGCDLYLSPQAKRDFPYGVEVKKQETVAIWKWLEQCEYNATKNDLIPLLVFSRNRSKTYAVIEWEHFLHLVKRANK